jgi:hypothetical protein
MKFDASATAGVSHVRKRPTPQRTSKERRWAAQHNATITKKAPSTFGNVGSHPGAVNTIGQSKRGGGDRGAIVFSPLHVFASPDVLGKPIPKSIAKYLSRPDFLRKRPSRVFLVS